MKRLISEYFITLSPLQPTLKRINNKTQDESSKFDSLSSYIKKAHDETKR